MSADLALEPYLPAASITHLRQLAENGEIVTLDGEVLPAHDASSDDCVAWILIANRLRDIARLMQASAEAEMHIRVRESAGPVETEYGTARESISRGSVSGIGATRIRELLEGFATEGVIPWSVVDNVAPLQAHVTPAKAQQYAEDAPRGVGEALEALLPEKRRSLKIEQRVV